MAEKRIRISPLGDGGLHLDLWIDILSLLPVKTLIILRAVCKSFLSIIDDPDFVCLHLRRFPNNLSQTLILTADQKVQNNTDKRGIITYHALDSVNNLSYPITSYKLSRCQFLRASLDGLLLLVSHHPFDGRRLAELLNPSIDKRRPLPLPSPDLTQFGLGYHRNDYKVIAASASRDEAWLYSVKTGSWTEISNSGLQYCERGIIKRSYFSKSLSFKNGVIWIEGFESCYNRFHSGRLVWFDFRSERFRYTTGETFYENFNPEQLVVLDGGASVGVYGVDAKEQVSVWALEADGSTWTRRYEISHRGLPHGVYAFNIRNILCVEKDGMLVWRYLSSEQYWVTVFTYDIKTKTINHDIIGVDLTGECKGLYFESLVMLH